MFYQLSNIRFEGIISPSALSKTKSAVYAEHALIEGKPVLQRLGDGLDTVDLSIHFHSRFCNPEQELDRLYALQAISDGLPFLTGEGRYLGLYVITDIGKTIEQAGVGGHIISVRVDVKLKELVKSNPLQDDLNDAVASGFAYDTNAPVETLRPIPPQSTTSSAALGLIDGRVAGNQALGAIEGGDLTEAGSFFGAEAAAVQAAGLKLATLSANLSDKLGTLQADIATFLLENNNLKTAADLGNAALVQAGLADYIAARQNMRRSEANLAAIAATRR